MSVVAVRRAAMKLDALSLRERLLIFVSALTALLLGWYQFAMTPVLTASTATLTQMDTVRERIVAVESAARAQAELLNVGAASSAEQRLAAARERVADINAEIHAHADDIVDPATMARVLEELLAEHSGLRLRHARNLQAERLEESDEQAPLYRHTLRLELEGPYLTVLDYLRKLETLPWRIYWQGIEIDAREYPRNRVRIDVSTLSFEEDWIGV